MAEIKKLFSALPSELNDDFHQKSYLHMRAEKNKKVSSLVSESCYFKRIKKFFLFHEFA